MPACPACHLAHPAGAPACAGRASAKARAGAEPPLGAGARVGEYVVEGELGEGGFGRVYRVTHALIGKAAAVKVLNRALSADPVSVARFVEEARAVNRIRHRNIVDIFGFGTLDDGRHYYVMELLEGETLAQRVARVGPLAVAEALPLLRGVAKALGAAHAAGVVHRDLKPDNVFVAEADGAPTTKLLDFGIAKLFGHGAAAPNRTRDGAYIGTPHFMAPEQCRGRAVDGRTDVYAFGVLAYKVLTGCVPFDAEEAFEILHQHTSAPAPAMSERFAFVPPALDGPVLRMLEKDPARRPATIGQAMGEFERAAAPYAPGAGERRPSATIPAVLRRGAPGAPPRPLADTLPAPLPTPRGSGRWTPAAATALPAPRAPLLTTPHALARAPRADVRRRWGLSAIAGSVGVAASGLFLAMLLRQGGADASASAPRAAPAAAASARADVVPDGALRAAGAGPEVGTAPAVWAARRGNAAAAGAAAGREGEGDAAAGARGEGDAAAGARGEGEAGAAAGSASAARPGATLPAAPRPPAASAPRPRGRPPSVKATPARGDSHSSHDFENPF